MAVVLGFEAVPEQCIFEHVLVTHCATALVSLPAPIALLLSPERQTEMDDSPTNSFVRSLPTCQILVPLIRRDTLRDNEQIVGVINCLDSPELLVVCTKERMRWVRLKRRSL